MPEPEIVHPVPVEDVEPWLRALLRGLLVDPFERFDERVEQNRLSWEPDRNWGVRDGNLWVGTLRADARTLTVPGPGGITNEVALDALAAVSVAATHRRRGLLTAMIGSSLRAAKDRGDAVSGLIAAEYPIYGRFGYSPATRTATYRYAPRARGATLPPPPSGRLRHVEPAALRTQPLRDAIPAVFAAARRRCPGQVDRPESWWLRALRIDPYRAVSDPEATWVVHDGADGPDGFLIWRVTKSFGLAEPAGAVRVLDLVAANDEAYRDLWAYLGGLDLVAEIELSERPVDEPIHWLLPDARTLRLTELTDFLWLRLLDVPTALAARAYAVDGELVLDVVDDTPGGYAAGTVALVASGTDVTCTPTTRPAELRLSQRALASAYLGGHPLAQRSVRGDVEELASSALARFDAMFASAVPPWNATWF